MIVCFLCTLFCAVYTIPKGVKGVDVLFCASRINKVFFLSFAALFSATQVVYLVLWVLKTHTSVLVEGEFTVVSLLLILRSEKWVLLLKTCQIKHHIMSKRAKSEPRRTQALLVSKGKVLKIYMLNDVRRTMGLCKDPTNQSLYVSADTVFIIKRVYRVYRVIYTTCKAKIWE